MNPRAIIQTVICAVPLMASTTSWAQIPGPAETEPHAPIMTVLSSPPNVLLSITGPAEVYGNTPMDLPSSVVGRFSVLAGGGGVARTQGVFFFPVGSAPYALSEPPGLSAGLLIRSLNYPGLPNITAKRALRGLPLTLAATGAIAAGTFAHLRYRDRLDEPGAFAGLRARDERHARNAWAMYGGATWALSAVDYWIRPRFGVQEATPTRLSLVVPQVTRTAVAWRSAIVPGAGQEFANHRTRGALWLAGVLAAGAGYTLAEVTVQRTKSDLTWNQMLASQYKALADSGGPTDQARYLNSLIKVEGLKNDLQSARDVRRGLAYAGLGIYAASLIDAFVLSVGPPASGAPPKVSAAFPIRSTGPAVAVIFRY